MLSAGNLNALADGQILESARVMGTGKAAMAKARFVKVTGATKELDQALIDRARQLAALKGCVTNLPATRSPPSPSSAPTPGRSSPSSSPSPGD
jgi:hypothetical protein